MSALKEQDIIPPESWIGTVRRTCRAVAEVKMVELLEAQSTTYRCICL